MGALALRLQGDCFPLFRTDHRSQEVATEKTV